MDEKQKELDSMVRQHLDEVGLGMDVLQREVRRGLCTGTKIAKILGKSKFGTGYDVFAKAKGLVEDKPPTDAMIRGTVLEDSILSFYELKCECILERPKGTLIHPTEDWAGASPDGFYFDEDDMLVIVDAKTSRSRSDWGEEFSDDVPIDYQLQLLWYAYVLGAVFNRPVKRLDIHVYFPLQDQFLIFTMSPDEELIEKMVERCRTWWWRHIVSNVAPAVDWSDSATEVVSLIGQSEDALVKTDSEGRDLIVELMSTKDAIKSLDRQKKELENQIKDLIGESAGIYYGGSKATWKSQKGRSKWNTKALESDHPELAKKYKEDGKPFRVLRTKV